MSGVLRAAGSLSSGIQPSRNHHAVLATIGPLKVTIVCAALTADALAGYPQESGVPIGPDRL